jgi:hypothetical protein
MKPSMLKRNLGFMILPLISLFLPFTLLAGPIIVDHAVVNQYASIPPIWMAEVMKMQLCLPGESHSRGYVYGLELLEAQDTTYSVNSTWSGEPEGYTDQHLRIARTYWNGSGWNGAAGESDFWTNETGRTIMKNHLDYMRNSGNTVNAFGFGWCWDMLWGNPPTAVRDPVYEVGWAGTSVGGPQGNLPWGLDDEDSSITGNTVSLQTYLNTIEEYNAHNPETVSFFTTGPSDGYAYVEAGYQAYIKNEVMRQYVRDHEGILFDYADILCYNDNGEQDMQGDWNGHTFPYLHSSNGGNYDSGLGEAYGCHISAAGCLRLGKALWYMMARIAGWDGTAEVEKQGEEVPQMLNVLQNYPNPFNPTTKIQFTVPSNGYARVRIYNCLGQIVAVPFEGEAKAGRFQTVQIDGTSLSSGVYFYSVEHKGQLIAKQMVLIK